MEIHVVCNPKDAALTALEILDRELRPAAASRASVGIAISGGRTPEVMFRQLALPTMQSWPVWPALHVFWADERAVAPDDPDSNYRSAWESFLSKAPLDPARVHRMRGEAPDLDAEARRYEREDLGPWAGITSAASGAAPRLDLVLLGLGPDGHTASLFPESPALSETQRWVVAAPGPPPHVRRLTLTLPVLNAARAVLFLVTGREKAEAVRQAIMRSDPVERIPASAVQPADGRLYWVLDEAAATRLDASLIAAKGR
ncbi:MAG TPA: 6-phosphogluconolactonase [Candidatus Eisenbacteria bacterium]|nr:6-phosphogluconolactonase [Candidatus Eisenbacteria bacterium]